MPDITVRIGQQTATKVISSAAGSGGTLAALGDVDTSGVSNGSVIVYNTVTSKWEATNTLTPGTTKNLDVNGGSF
jgi:hypothetical protein